MDVSERGAKLILQSNDKYLRDIRKRLDENAAAREQREKRLQRFVMEQIKAREAQEVKLLVFILLLFLLIITLNSYINQNVIRGF